ncbi:hypothetical protein DFR58_13123 [Anaerobacterium chartisolvens]|uniref:Uncharacterized protein n=1 Tax=Anaerobacterium chartisolvens TaxID=1297424 RepID=A0A369AKP3_9FIRM|nr:hypothetical protein [Anaerobacterium chartisolvens]RCX09979.1 hypothetical protein DFR58_13123 [Anaerobacterium chartisolvens]
MKLKYFKFHGLYFVLLIVLMGMGGYALNVLKSHVMYREGILAYLYTELLFCFIFGLLLALPYIIQQKTKKGPWGINTPKILFLALPCFIFILWQIFSYSGDMGENFLVFNYSSVFYNKVSNYLIAVLLGYSLPVSLYKKGEESNII